ncbi:MAG TPA: bifunctional 2-C-methyl-D-erythritol 4-phosphate cytidylyltransferase/2-C-methyl-D-erythritol 2,4-cyclodiphosphate synthase [Henriciella marina]|uniref:bifunctional 2-C-methyl-D-erythritol 4-phosphate cytidylyltransferase/2-C-methyl-D-erythritol 2,4-cyclodiphosphate synthase n=1 Tax=Henriciella sp. TaxID=1968823 RepID=UPI0018416E7D|nr:bifunctional 2-C-methyl-D-erythritol 4-phosphate cytidylyltransferase/2-C-methyl-D-erythritol 2,4-cyclodiphosphate synthase [Henriciella sp.]HIG21610.1 bifunctional 2-C-methyl-D-erythritol 4-phosphate cytidylyltransferase/2-C-methyl-D-erythritol 2,4-cyclodiphosphate synthase [Henriciella sp.]HIK64043.1 bifunctional 2-C-methyl-D-erythritol 4-phosphate cytidylyltransferase/2-C-methyl-D-erythritol 2,4-cyclodiphosphate synthase [Henriciella marina]
MRVHAIIVAAGSGSRTGRKLPKQFEMLAGKPVYRWSLDTFLSDSRVDRIGLVLPSDHIETIAASAPEDDRLMLVEGGSDRTASVRNAVEALGPAADDIILVHDAARPGLQTQTITALLDGMKAYDAAAPALPVIDALKRRADETLQTVDRSDLYRVQTPQAFKAGILASALADKSGSFVDDLEAVEALGARAALVDGNERLSKITFANDFERMEALMAGQQAEFRFGTGFDVHAFEPGPGVTLCGTFIEHSARLKGHSDADAGWHALTDAILGAVSLGDIGDHFPPSDDRWKDADSGMFLSHAIMLAREAGWQLTHCDITLICETPKIKPHREAMRKRTAKLTELELDAVSIKATTTEGLGFTGRREGIAAQAAATLRKII